MIRILKSIVRVFYGVILLIRILFRIILLIFIYILRLVRNFSYMIRTIKRVDTDDNRWGNYLRKKFANNYYAIIELKEKLKNNKE